MTTYGNPILKFLMKFNFDLLQSLKDAQIATNVLRI
jgi:hypothetical protein